MAEGAPYKGIPAGVEETRPPGSSDEIRRMKAFKVRPGKPVRGGRGPGLAVTGGEVVIRADLVS